jgi:alanine racemase
VRPAWVEVDLAALRANLAGIRRLVGPQRCVFAVVKANAYGHGLVPVARHALAHGADALAVAILAEAEELREGGVTGSILIMGESLPEQAEEIAAAGAMATVSSGEVARALSRAAAAAGHEVGVHVKVNSGMNRIGAVPEEAVALALEVASLPGLALAGMSSHLASADEVDDDFSARQLRAFARAVDAARAAGVDVPCAHTANSAAIVRYPEMHLDGVRPGLVLYGLDPLPAGVPGAMRYHPVLSLRARLVRVTEVEAGAALSYGRTYVTARRTRLGLVPVGYADGYDRRLSGRGEVLVRGRHAPLLGRVCMDQFIVDVTDIPHARAGDEVTLIGTDAAGGTITAHEIADAAGTIVHEIVSRLGPRLPRRYINEAPEEAAPCPSE